MNILRYLKSYGNDAYKLLVVLLLVDLFFVLCHIIIALFFDFEPKFLLTDRDRGLPEFFQYFKFIFIISICLYIIIDNKQYRFLPWAALFFLMFLDDAYQIHEHMGAIIAEKFNLKSIIGLRPRDIGEIIYAGISGSTVFGALAICFYKGPKIYRKTCIDISILLALLIFFGIGIDMVHQWLVDVDVVSAVVALIEDGGEMITLSLLVWYFYNLRINKEAERLYIMDSLIFFKNNYSEKKPFNRIINL